MSINSLQPTNWFTRAEMQLISHPGAGGSNPTQTADASASSSANTSTASTATAQVSPFASRLMAVLIDAQAKGSAAAVKASGLAQVPGGSAPTAAGAAAAVVQAFDTDGDGQISLSEFEAGLQPNGATTYTDASTARIEREFNKLTGGTGELTAADLTTALQTRETNVAARLASKQAQNTSA